MSLKITGASSAALSATFARKQGNTVVALGDSITAQNWLNSGGVVAFALRGYLTVANMLLGQRLKVLNPAGGGVGGNTTTQILARVQADAIAYNPAWCIVEGGTNDIGAGTSVSTITANLQAIYTALLAAGIRVIATTILPRNGAGDTATMRQNILTVNQWIKDYARTTPGITVCDWHQTIVDPATGLSDASCVVSDGIHPNGKGAILMGAWLHKVLNPLIPENDKLPTSNLDPANLCSNGLFTGNASGIATSWTIGHDTGNASTNTKVARTDGLAGEWQQVQITANTTKLNTTNTYFQNQTPGTGWNVGDTVAAEVECEIDLATLTAGTAGGKAATPFLVLNFFGASGSAQCGQYASGDPDILIPIAPAGQTTGTVRLTLATPAAVVPSGTTRLQLQCFAPKGYTGTIRWGRARMRTVPAGTVTT